MHDMEVNFISFEINLFNLSSLLDKPYISDIAGIADCLGDLGEAGVIFCMWFKDFISTECSELCCYYILNNGKYNTENDYDL